MLQTVKKRLKCVSEPPQKRNESEAELVASQSCSQSAAEPLHQAKTAEGLTSRSRMTRTQLDVNAQIRFVTMQMKCGVTRTGGSRERRDGRIARNPAQFARILVYFWACCAPPECRANVTLF